MWNVRQACSRLHVSSLPLSLLILSTTKFKTYPELLVLHMKKFQLVNWLPTKLDVPVQAPDSLNLDRFHGTGRQPGEEELDIDSAPAAAPQFDSVAMSQLEAMGFPTVRCQKALLATGGNDAEMATAWLFEHMDDPGECRHADDADTRHRCSDSDFW